MRQKLRETFFSIVIGTSTFAMLSGCSVGGSKAVQAALGDPFGTVGDSAFAATPSSLDFGKLLINATSTKTIQLANTSAFSILVTDITLNSPHFRLVSDTCPRLPLELKSKQSCLAILNFVPLAAGRQGAALQIKYGTADSAAGKFSSSFAASGAGVSALNFAGIASIDNVTHKSMRLNWAANSSVASYLIFKIVNGTMVFENIMVNSSGTVNSAVISNLQPSTNYSWRVRGIDALGNPEENLVNLTQLTSANLPPTLATIPAQTSYQGSLWNVDAMDSHANNDFDEQGDPLTYTCFFDTVVDGAVGTTNSCASLINEDSSPATFVASTGILTWTPPYSVVPGTQYEFKITGTDPYGASDAKIFVNTVQSGIPIVAHVPAGDFVFPNNYVSMTQSLLVDFQNSRTGDDSGIMYYACAFDHLIDGAVGGGADCATLPGTVSFNTATGLLNWTPSNEAWGGYELKVTATNLGGSASEIVAVNVRSPIVTSNLLAYWDATFADSSRPGKNTPLLTAWKDLTSPSLAASGVLANFNGTGTSGWGNGPPPSLALDGVNDEITFGTLLAGIANVGIDAWIKPSMFNGGILWSNGDAAGNGLSLFQSQNGDGKLILTTGLRTYVDEVLADAPLGYWRADQPASPLLRDISGHDLTASVTSSVTSSPIGAINDGDGSINFDGSSGSFNAPYAVGTTISIEVWAKASGVNNVMLWRTGPSNSGPDLFFSSGVISLNTWDSSNNPLCNIPVTAADGQFHHYVTVIDGSAGTAKLYYDGVICGSAAYRNPSATSVSISSGLGTYEWPGSVDEIAIYGNALSGTRITAHYNAKTRATCRSNGAVVPNIWQHVTGLFDGSTNSLSLYVNGESQCSSIHPSGISASPTAFSVSSSGTTAANHWAGSIGELRAYTSASPLIATTNFTQTKIKYAHVPLANLHSWFRADSLTNLTDSQLVPVWPDQGPNRNHARQSDPSSRPIYSSNGINSKPGVQFSNSCLVTSNATSFANYTIFIVFKDDGISTNSERLLDHDYANGWWIGRNQADNNSFLTGYREASAPYGISATFSQAQPHILTTRRAGTARQLYSDGTLGSANVVSAAPTNSNPIGIGCWYNNDSGNRFGGTIGEILIYSSALADSDRVLVEKYLGAKYGIAVP